MYKLLIIILLCASPKLVFSSALPPVIETIAAKNLPIEPTKKAEKQRRPVWLKRMKPDTKAEQHLESSEWLAILGGAILLAALILFPVAYFNGILWMFLSSFIVLGLVFLGALFLLIVGFLETLGASGRFSGLALGLAAIVWYVVILLLLIDFIIIASIAWLPLFWYILGGFILAILLPIIFGLIAGM